METFLKMLETQSILFVYMAVGYYCRKVNIFSDEMRAKLTDFTVMITLPCMVFKSFLMEFSMDALIQGGVALLIASIMAVVALIAGNLLYNRFVPREKCIMQYGTLVTNSGFAGLPIVGGAFGDEGLFLGSLFIIPTRILMWSAGISLFTTGGTRWERTKKVLTNPSIIAVGLGLVWMVFQLPLPGFLRSAVGNLGNCTSPLAMALVGAILADVPLRGIWEPKALYLAAVRQIVLPVILLVALKGLSLDPLTVGVSVTLSGMPIGSTTAILAQKYGADAEFGSKCVFISTVTSLITVPVLTLFL